MAQGIEIRCPIYGFIAIDAWEREIISQPAFQRLRRIRQLAWTEHVYPGAMHTRFEHSLGVMHMATMLYDGIVERSKEFLERELGYNDAGRKRYRQLIRLATLLHDVGHGPFSHAVEELAPEKAAGYGQYTHEDYSTAIIKRHFQDLIENHPDNNNYGFRIEEVTGLIDGGESVGRGAVWRDLVSGQLDADRMDYLLRDSYHCGVEYGRYDWRRIVATVSLVRSESGAPQLGISEAGRHAAEAMIIARYMMFNQVYFHKTRVILDYHLHYAVQSMLSDGLFPPPIGSGIDEYLRWDDWRVFGELSSGRGGDHGRRLMQRDFYREVWHSPEFPNESDELELVRVEGILGNLLAARRDAGKSWYRVGETDIPIIEASPRRAIPLSMRSTIVGNMKPTRLARLYVDRHNRGEAIRRIEAGA